MKDIRMAQVIEMTGLSRARIYRYMDKDIFPRPYRALLKFLACHSYLAILA